VYFIFYNVFSLRTWETIEQFKGTAEEYDVYFRACLAAEADDLTLTKSFEEGLEKGREEKEVAIEKTKKIKKIEMAKSMVLKRINVNTISEITKLSKEEIEKLLP
jgi:predicted transposase/invertase (TIGR01784 family)